MVRTPPFHGGNRGSNPLRDAISLSLKEMQTKKLISYRGKLFLCVCDSAFVMADDRLHSLDVFCHALELRGKYRHLQLHKANDKETSAALLCEIHSYQSDDFLDYVLS